MVDVDPDKSRFGGRHTEQKLSVLGRYLTAYNTALNRTNFRRWYIDVFAGSGHREAPEAPTVPGQSTWDDVAPGDSVELPGSAHLALDTDPPFHHYVFIERHPDKANQLRLLVSEHPQVASRVQVEEGDGPSRLLDLCRTFDRQTSRGVLFLDPFGMQVEWHLLEAVAATQAIDCWMLFPLGTTQRLLAGNPSAIPLAWQEKLDRFFGEPRWRSEMYEQGPVQQTLFGEEESSLIKRRSHNALLGYVKRRLEQRFCLVNDPLILNSKTGSPIFALFFMMNNDDPKAKGLAQKIANWIVKREQGDA